MSWKGKTITILKRNGERKTFIVKESLAPISTKKDFLDFDFEKNKNSIPEKYRNFDYTLFTRLLSSRNSF